MEYFWQYSRWRRGKHVKKKKKKIEHDLNRDTHKKIHLSKYLSRLKEVLQLTSSNKEFPSPIKFTQLFLWEATISKQY